MTGWADARRIKDVVVGVDLVSGEKGAQTLRMILTVARGGGWGFRR